MNAFEFIVDTSASDHSMESVVATSRRVVAMSLEYVLSWLW